MQIDPFSREKARRNDHARRPWVPDSLAQHTFDDIAAIAAATCNTPIVLIALAKEHRQWTTFGLGLQSTLATSDLEICFDVIGEPEQQLVIEDARLDPRFSSRQLLLQDPEVRFFAGAPIVTSDGIAVGCICVLDRCARPLSGAQMDLLRRLAKMVLAMLDRERERGGLQILRSSEADHRSQMLAALTASGLDLISYIGPDYVYRYVNHRYLTYWGKQESDIVGHKVVDLVGQPLFDATVRPHLERAMAGEEVGFETQVNFTGIGKRFVEVVYMPARDEDGTLGVVVRSHDIDAIKQRKAQLRDTVALLENKTLEQERFIHIISHDLREPINTINNFASLLAQDDTLALPAHGQRYLRFVQEGGNRMAMLLDDLLNFVRLEKHAIDLKPVDLALIAAQVHSDLNSYLVHSGGEIEIADLPQVIGDASLLRIVVQNLVSNGLKFRNKDTPPLVRLSARCDNTSTYISVTDNGIGIPDDKLDRIFEMFQRLHSRKEFEGTGLGLSICRRVAELHGGSMSVVSRVGEGSCFTLCLPNNAIQHEERIDHGAL